MKRRHLVSLLLALALLFSLSVPALAVNAQYPTTASFLSVLDKEDVKYNYKGVDQDEDEEVTVSYTGDYADSIRANIFFDDDLDSVSMRVWDVIEFDESDYFEVLKVANELNFKYKFVYFVVDEKDWTVYATIDIPIRDCDAAGDITYDALYYLIQITDLGYDALKDYNI